MILSKKVRKRHFKYYSQEIILKEAPEDELLRKIITDNTKERLLPELETDENSPIGLPLYDSAHNFILEEVMLSLESLKALRKTGTDLLKSNWPEFSTRMKQCSAETFDQFTCYHVYPNLKRNGFSSNIDWELGQILDGKPVRGIYGGITPWQNYYFITAVIICSYDFIDTTLKTWATTLRSGSNSNFTEEDLRAIQSVLYEKLRSNYDYCRQDHHLYPYSISRYKARDIVRENKLNNSREYYLQLMDTFVNDIKIGL